MKIAAGIQRAVAIIGEDATGIMDHVQGWLDEGWRFLGLTYLAAEEGSAILVIEAGPDCKDEPDDEEGTTQVGEWSCIGSGGELRIRSSMSPVSVLELVCETGADEPSHHVRLEEGQRITADLIMRLEDLLIAVDEEHSETLEEERREGELVPE